jgi:uncharacterized membrane protein
MLGAGLALVGLFVSLYLWFWKIGLLGVLACGDGGCETVQLSQYASLAGIPVAFFGVVGYAAMLAVSLAGLHGRAATRAWPTLALLALSGAGLLFSGYLTYLEAAVIHAWCRWCVVSAFLVAATFVVAVVGFRRKAWMAVGG